MRLRFEELAQCGEHDMVSDVPPPCMGRPSQCMLREGMASLYPPFRYGDKLGLGCCELDDRQSVHGLTRNEGLKVRPALPWLQSSATSGW